MTDEQVVERLEKRMGGPKWVLMKRGIYYRPDAKGYTTQIQDAWKLTESEADKHVYTHDQPVSKRRVPAPPFLTSRDALTPILEGLSKGEQNRLHSKIGWTRPLEFVGERFDYNNSDWTFYLLTMPATKLAHTLASILEDAR